MSLQKEVSLGANRKGGFLNLRRVLAFKTALRYPEKGACGLTGNPRNAEKIYSETVSFLGIRANRAFIAISLAS